MSSLRLAHEAVTLLQSVGYDDAAVERRRIGRQFVGVVAVSPNDALGVFPPGKLILAVDPEAEQLN